MKPRGVEQGGRPPRSRVRVTVALAGAIGLGLLSRSGYEALPGWFAQHAGDALWASALYLGLAWLTPRARPVVLLGTSLGVSFLVELSQLWHTPWLDELRRTLPGRLLLGAGWQWADLPRYAVGAILALAVDRAACAPRGRR